MKTKENLCEVCHQPATWGSKRCDLHYRCDDCGDRFWVSYHPLGVFCDACLEKRIEKKVQSYTHTPIKADTAICPHCGYRHKKRDFSVMKNGELCECWFCNREFTVQVSIIRRYETFPGGVRWEKN